MSLLEYEEYVELSGDGVTPEEDVRRLLGPASDIVDGLTRGRARACWEGLGEPSRQAVRRAVAAEVMFLEDNGGMGAVINGAPRYSGSVKVGSFRYGDGRLTDDDNGGVTDSRVGPGVLEYLLPTGLTGCGVGGRGSGCRG